MQVIILKIVGEDVTKTLVTKRDISIPFQNLPSAAENKPHFCLQCQLVEHVLADTLAESSTQAGQHLSRHLGLQTFQPDGLLRQGRTIAL